MCPTFDEKQATKIAEAVETALETNNSALFSTVATKGDLAELKAATKADYNTPHNLSQVIR